jgi:hypothetical protein
VRAREVRQREGAPPRLLDHGTGGVVRRIALAVVPEASGAEHPGVRRGMERDGFEADPPERRSKQRVVN